MIYLMSSAFVLLDKIVVVFKHHAQKRVTKIAHEKDRCIQKAVPLTQSGGYGLGWRRLGYLPDGLKHAAHAADEANLLFEDLAAVALGCSLLSLFILLSLLLFE